MAHPAPQYLRMAQGTATVAGTFIGNVGISGSLSKGGSGFLIDHPLDPVNQYLRHSSVESPDMLNLYSGIIPCDDRGEATVELPVWFEALNNDFRNQLTAIGASCPTLFVAMEISKRRFKVGGGVPGLKVSWLVTGVRQDAWAKANRIVAEEAKTAGERSRYLHPEVIGQPPESHIHHALKYRGKQLLEQNLNTREALVKDLENLKKKVS